MRQHLKHLAMCSPMLVIAGVLIATGTGVAALIPVAACVAMMWVMMSAMGGSHGGHDGGH